MCPKVLGNEATLPPVGRRIPLHGAVAGLDDLPCFFLMPLSGKLVLLLVIRKGQKLIGFDAVARMGVRNLQQRVLYAVDQGKNG